MTTYNTEQALRAHSCRIRMQQFTKLLGAWTLERWEERHDLTWTEVQGSWTNMGKTLRPICPDTDQIEDVLDAISHCVYGSGPQCYDMDRRFKQVQAVLGCPDLKWDEVLIAAHFRGSPMRSVKATALMSTWTYLMACPERFVD